MGSLFHSRLAAPSGHPLLTSQHSSGEITGWKSFSEDAKTKTGDVWTLGADGILVCKENPLGYLYTNKNYTDFALTLQVADPARRKAGQRRRTPPHDRQT